MSNKKFDLFKRNEELPAIFYIVLAILALAVQIILCNYTDVSPAKCGIAVICAYLVISIIIALAVHKKMLVFRLQSDASEEQNNGVIHTFKNYLHIPYAIVNESGKIVTVNAAMRHAAGPKNTIYNADIASACNISLGEILSHFNRKADATAEDIFTEENPASECITTFGERTFRVDCHLLNSKNKIFYMLVFKDITELTELTAIYKAEHTAVGYILLDNLEDIAQYVKVSYQEEATKVDKILKEWASSINAVIREYERNKYIIIMSRQSLLGCVKNKFDILDDIREIKVGEDNMPITVSIGIATTGNTLYQREHDALVSLDMALQRGGDQVVLKNETGTFFFGGRTKTQQKRSGGHAKIIANRLCSMISGASNVIIMGHTNPDFDSIGACVGIAVLCHQLGVDAKIVTDIESDNFKACTSRLIELSDYKNIFVDGIVGLGEIAFGTLLIIVDANNFKILEAPEIAKNSFKTVVIDHHIKKEEFENEPQLVYIDPSASSACEMISEILECSLVVGKLRAEEANVILAGIMVDTQNFTRTVGSRTFSSALYLRNAGASPEYVRTFFKENFESYRSEALFGANTEIYKNNIAITWIDGVGSANDRVTAAKAADKLLGVKSVNAAFALVKIGDLVHVSGRSNGSINVQLILEKVGGGGHFDVAGAALAESGTSEAKARLIEAIDQYFEDISRGNDE